MTIKSTIQPETQPGVEHDARRRTDDYRRDDAGGATRTTGGNVLDLLERSAQTLHHAAESVENRGLKLLLKVVAQERVHMFNALRHILGKEIEDPLDDANEPPATSLQQGLQDIQTGMTVQRQGREKVALSHLIAEENELLAAYAAALGRNISETVRVELEAQQARVAQFYSRLAIVESGVEPIVARVFDTRIEGEMAVQRLREQGLDASQIDAAPITQLAQPLQPTVIAPSGPKNTMAAGAFSGALVGGIAGLVLAAFVWLTPQFVGWITVGPWALLIGAIVIGAVFGTVFGFFIGQNKREDDLAVTVDGLINGEILVVAYPQPQQVAMVEDVLGVHHARELNR